MAADSSYAQPFAPEADVAASSVDLLVAAVTAATELAVDVVGDLDGKPGSVSLLPAVAIRSLTRDEAPGPTWVNAPLPGEIELLAGQRYWMVVQARQGRATWALASGAGPPPQVTRDGGLSWRTAAAAPAEAQFRLRRTTTTFHMPLELRVGVDAGAVAVDLDRFGAAGRVDFRLDFPELASAINQALTVGGAGAPPREEHIANGGFERWFKLGSELAVVASIQPAGEDMPVVPVFSPDGATLYLVSSTDSGTRLHAYDTYCRLAGPSVDVPGGSPTAMLVSPAGTLGVVATVSAPEPVPISDAGAHAAASQVAGTLVVVDLVAGRVIGDPVAVVGDVRGLAGVADGSGLYVLLVEQEGSTIARIDWAALSRAAERGAAEDLLLVSRTVDGEAAALAVGPEGAVFVLSRSTDDGGVLDVFDAHLSDDSLLLPSAVPSVDAPRDVAFAAAAGRLVVLGASDVAIVDPRDAQPRATLPLVGAAGRRLAADPPGESVLVATDGQVLWLDVGRRTLQETSVALSGGLRAAISPPGNRALLTSEEGPGATLLRVGEDLPAEWELTSGRVTPACFGSPPQPVAALGSPTVGRQPAAPAASALSQVVPVQPNTPYRFAFDALAELEGATAEILWRADDCGAGRIDVIDITTLESQPPRSISALTPHERAVISPREAIAAEVRFHAREGVLLVDRVSLAGSTEAVANASLRSAAGSPPGWKATTSQLSARAGASGPTVLHNAGTGEAALSQTVPVTGVRWRMEAVARTDGDVGGGAVVVEFRTASGVQVGDAVRLGLHADGFDLLAASGEVPAGADDAWLAVAVPARGSVAVQRLSLRFDDPVAVSLRFVSEAPGDLVVSDVAVRLDTAPPHRPPLPESGLCPATPPGAEPGEDPESCHCSGCGHRSPIRRAVAIRTPAGRPGGVSACPHCGTPRVWIGGTLVADAEARRLPEFSVGRPPAAAAVGPSVVVEEPLTVIDGIGRPRASALARLGIRTVTDLATADPAAVASLHGVSDDMARDLIVQARTAVRERGRRVLFAPGQQR